jgi:hypothetical protein
MGCVLRMGLSLAAVCALLVACVSPTLPLPPPLYPTVDTSDVPSGKVRLSSVDGAEPYAIIVTYNGAGRLPANERVFATEADGGGSWSLVIFAASGDYVQVTQQLDGETVISDPQVVQIP